MYYCDNYMLAVCFCVVTMFCWGSWGNTQKLAGRTWRYELFYWDYVLGVLLFALASGLTAGSMGANADWGFVANLKQASVGNLGSAFLGGVVFNAANILLSAAISVAGMSVAFPVGIGLALVLGVVVNYVGAPKGDAVTLFAGVALIVLAILCNAFAYKIKQSNNSKQSDNLVRGILLSVVCGVLMAFFYRFIACTMDMDFAKTAPAAGMMTPYSAFFVFALGIFASNFVFNAIAMRHPVSGAPIAERDYFRGGFGIHLVGVLGGLIWGLGNGISLVAAGRAGAAISYGLGQGATLVSALWGILIWREFRGAPRKAHVLNLVMFVLFLVGLGLIIAAGRGPAASEPVRRMTIAEFRDRMAGAWIGQSAGVVYGAPTEFKYKGELVPDSKMPEWRKGLVNGTFGQDDLYVEMTFIDTLDRRGVDVSSRLAGIDFANSRYRLWCANSNARNNLRNGVAAPASSHPSLHPTTDDIDYQIEADFSGILAPGLPQAAVDFGETFGRIMNFGDGLYAGQFVGAMYAAAYFATDRVEVVRQALAAIPAGSKYAEMVRDMLGWYRADPADWKGAWRKAVGKYRSKAYLGRISNESLDVKINGAMVLLGFLWGDGDMDRTMYISTAGGFDSDCNPSSACGVLGTMLGARVLEGKYLDGFDRTMKWEFTDYTYPKLLEVSERLARQVVVRYGGRIETDDAGTEWLVVPERVAKPSAFATPDDPGPLPERSRLTAEENAQVGYWPCNQGAWSEPRKPHEHVKVIFDTDMYTDFDDAGALACLHALADAGECEILATVANTRNCLSVAMCEIVNAYYGRPDIPVGCVKGDGLGNGSPSIHDKRYGATVRKYARWVRHPDSSAAPDAAEVYRKVLSAQPDGSVVICSVGFLTNLRKLMEGDRDLVARKVKLWVAMACSHPTGKEYNSRCDWRSAKVALEKWPTPVVFTDYQYGIDCFAGLALADSAVADNPVADVFRGNRESCNGKRGRSAWDETAVLIAVRGWEPYFVLEHGRYEMVGNDGEDRWIADPSAPGGRVTPKLLKDEVGKVIDELMCRPPKNR